MWGGESKPRNQVFSFRSSTTERLRLPSFSSLYSLKVLNISHCNLSEGALPSDLGSLPSLERLDLSGNSFITIPASLSGLSQLRSLTIEYCKSLQSLPELPSSIERLNAHSCTSLETFSCSSSAYTSKKFGDLRLNFTNCFRLGENQCHNIFEAILEGIQLVSSIPKVLDIEEFPIPLNEYNAFVPGSRIPEWFTHQSCAMDGYPGLAFNLNDHYYVHSGLNSLYTPSEGSRFIESDHTLFGYKYLAGLEGWAGNCFRKLSDNVVASFRFISPDCDCEAKKCGVRLVYEEDEKDGGCMWPEDGDGDGDDS
ncbi:TMV resistance protein N [Vitis vinifera]|uniref:TMV resistance protein N n=1 Tax=Vitis vinifera TaxID=29760 RepID=A0A438BVY2_VITVI|nr:TMV resistance protein N [Vitis vinifera]